MRTNDLFRDLLDGRIVVRPKFAVGGMIPVPGRGSARVEPVITQVGPMAYRAESTIYGHQYARDEYLELLRKAINTAHERMDMIRRAIAPIRFPALIDYGARQGLEGVERAHFNDAVDKMANTTPWTREECAHVLRKIMDAAQRAELEWTTTPRPDPRARALAHQQHRGTGPTPEPLRVRGLNNHYKEKR